MHATQCESMMTMFDGNDATNGNDGDAGAQLEASASTR